MAEIMKMMFLVAFLLLHAEYVEGYEFRLLPTNLKDTEGFVEIFYNGSWGLIGNPEFRFSDDTASLLCRKFNLSLFGYGARDIYQENNTFSYFWLQKLECNETKQSIDECVNTDEFNRTQYIKDEGPSLLDYGSKLYCVDYRLMGGLSQNTGMLLAAFSGTQHSMCYQGFDRSAGDVVCKHLRYNGLVGLTGGDPGSVPLFNNKLTCTGNENFLNECTMSNAVIKNCTKAVYITCKAVRLTRWNEYNEEGTVEIFYNGSWGVFDTPGFNHGKTTQFLCKTFGFRYVGFSSHHRLPTSYVGKGWYGYLYCNGTEADIMQCEDFLIISFLPHYYFSNAFGVGTWLYCFDFNITSMRLVNGPTPSEGDVELQVGGRWGSIYMNGQRKTSQVKTVGSVVCKILGYVGVSEIVHPFVIDLNKHTWMSFLTCNGNEIDLTDCQYLKGGYQDDRLAVKCEDTDQCQSNPCLNNGICVDGDRSYTCTCTETWAGINCEIDIDECLNQPCQNNGECVNAINGFVCNCVDGYEGNRCQNDIDECLNQPCENNGACLNAINGFGCFCADGYEGYRCQNEVGDQTTLIVVLISTICVLSIVVLATVCCCLRYRRKYKKTKSDASNVLNSGKGGLQNTKEFEAVQTELEEGQYIEDVYDGIKENIMTDVADYINPVNDVELPRDDDGYVKFADNDQSVGYYKLKHTETEDYSKSSVYKF